MPNIFGLDENEASSIALGQTPDGREFLQMSSPTQEPRFVYVTPTIAAALVAQLSGYMEREIHRAGERFTVRGMPIAADGFVVVDRMTMEPAIGARYPTVREAVNAAEAMNRMARDRARLGGAA